MSENNLSTIDQSVFMQDNDCHEDWDTTEADALDGDDSFSTITSASAAAAGTSSNSVTCARGAKRKAKDSSSSDPSIDSLASYFTAKSERLKSKPIETKSNMDEDDLYGKLVANDMKKIRTERIKRRLQKNISDLIYTALEDQEEEDIRQQEEFAQFFVAQQ